MADSASADDGEVGIKLPEGPVLYMGMRDSTGVRLVPIGEILEDSLAPFPDERTAPGYRGDFARQRMAPGTRFTLFSAGARVGTFTAAEVNTEGSFCTPRPEARGVVELVPNAAQATRFLALPETEAGDRSYAPYQPVQDDRAQRLAGIDLAAELIPDIGATWPSSMVDARGDMSAFGLESGESAFSATFLFRDQLRVQRAEPRSYSLFLMATPSDDGYRPAFVWYREAGQEGKGAPRFFQQLDWDGDGETEVLLEVLGERSRWTAALDRRGGEWSRSFEDPCGSAAQPVSGATAG